MYTKFLRGKRRFARTNAAQTVSDNPHPSVGDAFTSAPLAVSNARPLTADLDIHQLEDRTLYSVTPLGSVDVESAEDAPDTSVDLLDHFTLDDTGGAVTFEVTSNTNSSLFADVRIETLGRLVLDYAADAHGQGQLSIEGTDALGNIEQLIVNVSLESVNDAPTAISLHTVTTTDLASGETIIDLFAAFDDIEDADEDLTFELVGNSNAALFSSIVIDMDNGLLVLTHAEGQTGSAEVTVKATDTGRLSVGAGTADGFRLLETLSHRDDVPDEIDALNATESIYLTHWYFFEHDEATDTYATNQFEVQKLVRFLQNYDGDPSVPITIDIETDGYDNTAEGRDRLAEVFQVINDVRPDLEVGLYMLMPERNFWTPGRLAIAEDWAELGIIENADAERADYEAWMARNALWRTEAVSEEFGGTPFSDMVDSIQVSLYTFYEDSFAKANSYRAAELDAEANRLYVDGPSYDTIEKVRFVRPLGFVNNNGIQLYHEYFVVNADEHSFQISESENGPAIDFTDDYSGGSFVVGTIGPNYENMWHDPAVTLWEEYALSNIEEGRKFGDKPLYAWVSPSIKGIAHDYLEGDFFRYQLELMRSEVDSVIVYNMEDSRGAEYIENQAWWTALRDFSDSLDVPAATVTIEVTASEQLQSVNLAPIANSDDLSTAEDTPMTFDATELLSNDLDLEGDRMEVRIVEGPANGTLEATADGRWTYTPALNFFGADSFNYIAFDGFNASNTAMVEIDVRPVADGLVAHDDVFQTVEDQALTVFDAELLANDENSDNAALSLSIVTGPANGYLTRNANGSFYYLSDSNYYGADQFTYQISDGETVSQATVSIHVSAENDRPIAVADRMEVVGSAPLAITLERLVSNDVDAEGDALTVELVNGPTNGILRKTSDGSFEYIAKAGFVGVDQFEYRVSDGQLESRIAVVEIDVEAEPNRLPKASADSFVTLEDEALVMTVESLLANDRDADGDKLKIQLVDEPDQGSLRWTNSGQLVYVPNANYHGTDQFGYRVSDGTGYSDVVAVQVTIVPQNDAATTRADVYSLRGGTTLEVGGRGVLANDVDIEGDALKVTLARAPQHGRLQLFGDGTFTYEAHRNFSGVDQFTYRVTDAYGATSLATATIRVQALVDTFDLKDMTDDLFGQPRTLNNRQVTLGSSEQEKPLAYVP